MPHDLNTGTSLTENQNEWLRVNGPGYSYHQMGDNNHFGGFGPTSKRVVIYRLHRGEVNGKLYPGALYIPLHVVAYKIDPPLLAVLIIAKGFERDGHFHLPAILKLCDLGMPFVINVGTPAVDTGYSEYPVIEAKLPVGISRLSRCFP